MKPYFYFICLITGLLILQINSSYAEKGEWEILLDEFRINDIAHEGDYVWCATIGDGLLRYNKTDGSYIQYTTENGLPESVATNNVVYCVVADKMGLKWFGLPAGIASFNDTTWTVYNSLDLNNWVVFDNAIVDHDNIKWFSADGGIVAYNDTSFIMYDEYYEVNDIYVDHNNIKWFTIGERLQFDNMVLLQFSW